MKETVSEKQTVAVIDIGSSAIRMMVAEVGSKSEIRTLENLQKPVALGKEVFATQSISRNSLRDAITILQNFKTVIDSYGVKKMVAIATSAIREADNRENFIDQVYVRTGIDVEVIEGAEQNRLELLAVEHALKDKIDLEKKNCLIVEVGSGTTELIILNNGLVGITQTLALGADRLPEQTVAGKTEPAVMQRVLKRNVREVVRHAAREFNFNELDTFISLGADMRLVSRHLVDEKIEKFTSFEKKAFMGFVERVGKLEPEEIVNQYGISYEQAETFYPSLLIYANFLNATKAEAIIVPMASIRDGLLLELAQVLSGYKRTDVSKQVVNSAKHLAEKYEYDKAHALTVSSLAVKLFDELKKDHGMETRERMLLEVSAILHDIGMYISPQGHHKHSSYLINAAEIFGLRKSDKDILASVVRYHRRAVPKPSHVSYMSLPKSERAVVTKLAALLRVADALDHSHQQKIKNFTFERGERSYDLWLDGDVGDISVERDSLRQKGNLFADVFGAPVNLKLRTTVLAKK